MGTRGRVDTSPASQGCPRGLKLRVQYESHTLSYGGVQVAIGSRDHANVDLDGLPSSHSLEFPFLQHPQ